MSRTYPVVGDDWETPRRKGFKLACCDCGLVHTMDFRVHKGKIQFKIDRNNRATGQKRRHMKRKKEGIFEEE